MPVKVIPEITDPDIQMAERYLGVTFDAPRRQVLLSNQSFDVQACPGSGKTTLLVAKLAILAEKWPHARRGMCVLSHTNVARKEIETKLAGTAAGQRLLAYPHFVGTIHKFVDTFLALPLLRAEGKKVRLVDDQACFNWMKRRLTSWPTKKTLGNLAFKERTLDGGIWSLVCAGRPDDLPVPKGITTEQWTAFTKTKAEAVRAGLWFYDDMFAWAEKLLKQHPQAAEFARWRFPAVFVDEMQDTQELQGNLLASIFPASFCELRQRFGDSNQAIYDVGRSGTFADSFPNGGARSIPNSRRFSPGIASKAAALAPDPPKPALSGDGPQENVFPTAVNPAAMPHTILLFETSSIKRVFPAFGELLLGTFPDTVLHSKAFLARAIGRVGKPKEDGADAVHDLADYWEGYEPRVAKLEPCPQTLADFIHLAQRHRAKGVDCGESVKTALNGIIELIEAIIPAMAPGGGQANRWFWESVKNDVGAMQVLRDRIWRWCVEATCIRESTWRSQVEELKRGINPITGGRWTEGAEAFCRWSAELACHPDHNGASVETAVNCYRFTQGTRHVDIDVGTIHSAKGQTHTATLVVETFFKTHDMEDVLPWLVGTKAGAGKKEGVERVDRLRLLYTAMTRPSHLLCLAMRREALGGCSDQKNQTKRLEGLGWTVRSL